MDYIILFEFNIITDYKKKISHYVSQKVEVSKSKKKFFWNLLFNLSKNFSLISPKDILIREEIINYCNEILNSYSDNTEYKDKKCP